MGGRSVTNPPAASPASADGKPRARAAVDGLAAFVLARPWRPPVSVGVFADDPEERDRFVRTLEERIDAHARAARDAEAAGGQPAYATAATQIRVAAQPEADENPWASVVSGLVAGVSDALENRADEAPEAVGAERREELVRALHVTRGALVATADDRTAAGHARKQAEHDLRTAKERVSITGRRLSAVDEPGAALRRALYERDDVLGAHLARVARYEGTEQPPDAAAIDETLAGVETAWRRWMLAIRRALTQPVMLLTSVLGALAMAGAVWAYALLEDTLAETIRSGGLGVLAAVVATALILTFRPHLRRVQRLQQAALDAESRCVALRDHARTELRHELAAAEAARDDATERVEEGRQAAEELRVRVDAIQVGHGLQTYFTQVLQDAEPAARVELFGKVRQDLERLVGELVDAAPAEAGAPEVERGVDHRIVLYIDGVDGCTGEALVDVLQAVQLLLGMSAFVIVIPADARRLVRAVNALGEGLLVSKARLFEGTELERALHTTTAAAYLRQCVQVALALPPRGARAPATVPDLDPSRVSIQGHEQRFIGAISSLVPSPAERRHLAYAYRLLRASLDPSSLRELEGSRQAGGYEAVLLLLALLIGTPRHAPGVARALSQTRETTLKGFVESDLRPVERTTGYQNAVSERLTAADVNVWKGLCRRLLQVERLAHTCRTIEPLRRWGSVAARFGRGLHSVLRGL